MGNKCSVMRIVVKTAPVVDGDEIERGVDTLFLNPCVEERSANIHFITSYSEDHSVQFLYQNNYDEFKEDSKSDTFDNCPSLPEHNREEKQDLVEEDANIAVHELKPKPSNDLLDLVYCLQTILEENNNSTTSSSSSSSCCSSRNSLCNEEEEPTSESTMKYKMKNVLNSHLKFFKDDFVPLLKKKETPVKDCGIGTRKHPKSIDKNAISIALQKMFEVDHETIQRCLAVVSMREKPIVLVKVDILEAKNLRPKSSKGTSNPYCLVQLARNSSVITSPLPFMPTSSSDVTSVNTTTKHYSLNPSWEESFSLKASSNENEVKLQLWHEGQDESFVNRLEFGCPRVSQLKKQRNYLGGCTITLQRLQNGPMDEWLALAKRKDHNVDDENPNKECKQRGSLHIRMKLETRADLCTSSDGRLSYQRLVKKVVKLQIKETELPCSSSEDESDSRTSDHTKQIYVIPWSGKLPPHLQHMLHSYAVLLNLPKSSTILAWWIVTSTMQGLHHAFYQQKLKEIIDYVSENEYSTSDLKDLRDSISKWQGLMEERLINLRDHFSPSSFLQSHDQLSYLLQNLSLLENFPMIQNQTAEEFVTEALTRHVQKWWEDTMQKYQSHKNIEIESNISSNSDGNERNLYQRKATFYNHSKPNNLMKNAHFPINSKSRKICIFKKFKNSNGNSSSSNNDDDDGNKNVSTDCDDLQSPQNCRNILINAELIVRLALKFIDDSHTVYNIFERETNVKFSALSYNILTYKISFWLGPLLMSLYEQYPDTDSLQDPVTPMDHTTTNATKASTIAIDQLSLEMGSPLWSIYKNIIKLKSFSKTLLCDPCWSEQNLENWFKVGVTRWMKRIIKESRRLMMTELTEDEFLPPDKLRSSNHCNEELEDRHVRNHCSTTSDVFKIIIKNWERLAWSEVTQNDALHLDLLCSLCDLGMFYIEGVRSKLEGILNNDPSGDEAQMKNKTKLCIGLNNIVSIKKTIETLPECLWNNLPPVSGQHFEKVKITIQRIQDILNKFIHDVINKIDKYIESTVILSCAQGNEAPLLDYLDIQKNIYEEYLHPDIFIKYYRVVWKKIMLSFRFVVNENQNKKSAEFFKCVNNLLGKLVKYFTSSSHSIHLDPEFIESSSVYKEVLQKVEHLQLTTEELISKYYSERHKEQCSEVARKVGFITLRIIRKSSGTINLSIIMAQDISMTHLAKGSSNGGSRFPRMSINRENRDGTALPTTHVVIEVIPNLSQIYKTKKQKKTNKPVYDEDFDLQISNQTKIGHILLTLKARTGDIGETIVPISTITQVITSPTEHRTENTILPVTIPGPPTSYKSIHALEFRRWDKTATGFLDQVFRNR